MIFYSPQSRKVRREKLFHDSKAHYFINISKMHMLAGFHPFWRI